MNNKEKFNKYRQGILDLFNFDINNFEQSISGGLADNKQITDYLFSQLIAGIRVQKQHTNDISKAIQIAMDHLEQIPDYYSRLKQMEQKYKKPSGDKPVKQHKVQIFKQIVQEILQNNIDDYNTG